MRGQDLERSVYAAGSIRSRSKLHLTGRRPAAGGVAPAGPLN